MINILWLDDNDVTDLMTMSEAIPVVEEAFANLGWGRAQMPPKTYLNFTEYGGDLRAMPAYLPQFSPAGNRPFAGVKVVNSHPRNPSKGLPTVSAVLVLNNPENGLPLALMGAGRLTDLRTGAAGAVAAKYLARKSARVLGLVGCGRQAQSQLMALRSLFRFEEVRVAGATQEEAQDFCRRFAGDGEMRFVPSPADKAVEADIVVTTTPARGPVVRAEWIRPGTHVNAIGADAPGKQELDVNLLMRSRIFVDHYEQAAHSGEINVGLASGVLKREDIAGTLGEVVAGKRTGRGTDQEVTIFDSTGLAVQDIAVGAFVYHKAMMLGRGMNLPFMD